jgi:hypothetical protein
MIAFQIVIDGIQLLRVPGTVPLVRRMPRVEKSVREVEKKIVN